MPRKKTTRTPMAPTGSEEIPPGATKQAFDRPLNPEGGPPGSGAGPRHAAGDEDSPIEEYGATDTNEPLADDPRDYTTDEEGPPYAGPSGGAVGGAPAERRATGGRTGRGIAPGRGKRPDTTIGSDPTRGE